MLGYKADGVTPCECQAPCRACIASKEIKARLLADGYKENNMIHIRELIRRLRGLPPVSVFDQEPEPIPEFRSFLDQVSQYRVEESAFTSTRILRLHDRANWVDCDPQIMWFAGTLVLALRKRGLPFYVHTAYRSPQLQAQLQRAGYSNLSSGPHQRGAAVDIVHCYYHWNVPGDNPLWRYVGLLGEHIIRQNSLPIEWGGRWRRPYDPAHWQLKHWRDLPKVGTDASVNMTPHALVKFGTPYAQRRDDD